MKHKINALYVILPILAFVSTSAFSAELTYAASFALNGKPMKVLIHRPSMNAGASAQIQSENARVASCEVKSIERDETMKPVAVVMDCQNPGFKQLANTVTVFWPGLNPQNVPVIRFGTWLSGYEQAKLKVEVDRFQSPAKPVLTQKKAAEKQASFWLKKPRIIVKVAKSG